MTPEQRMILERASKALTEILDRVDPPQRVCRCGHGEEVHLAAINGVRCYGGHCNCVGFAVNQPPPERIVVSEAAYHAYVGIVHVGNARATCPPTLWVMDGLRAAFKVIARDTLAAKIMGQQQREAVYRALTGEEWPT